MVKIELVEKIIREAKSDEIGIKLSKAIVVANKELSNVIRAYSTELKEKIETKISTSKNYKPIVYFQIGRGNEINLQGGEYYYNHYTIIEQGGIITPPVKSFPKLS